MDRPPIFAQQPAVAARVDERELDALSEGFVALGDLANVNTNQVMVLSGALDAHRLEQAARAAIARVPLLRAKPARGRPRMLMEGHRIERALVHQRLIDGPIDLSDARLRRLITQFGHRQRLDWRRGIPLQILLLTTRDAQRSCVCLNTHHGVADARSDTLLLRAIVDAYASGPGRPMAALGQTPLPYVSLRELRPHWFTPLARLGRWLRAAQGVAQDLLVHDQGLQVGLTGSRWEGPTREDIGRVDFHHQRLEVEVQNRLLLACVQLNVTINTLWCAALLRLMERSTAEVGATLRVTCAVSLRKLVDARHERSFRNYLVPSKIRVPTGLSSDALLAQVQARVHAAREERQLSTELARMEALLVALRHPAGQGLARWLLNRCQGTNACYSNPGRIEEDLSNFGSSAHQTLQYIGFGCLVPPYDFILYTPTVSGVMQLDVVYRQQAFGDIQRELVQPLLAGLLGLLDEMGVPQSQRELA